MAKDRRIEQVEPRQSAGAPLSAVEQAVAKKPLVSRILAITVAGFVVLFCFFHIYTGFFGMIDIYANLTMTVTLIMIVSFLYHPLGRKSWNDRLNKWFIVDVLCILLAIGVQVYIIHELKEITVYRTSMANSADIIAGTIYVLLLLEITRRVLGYPMLGLCLFFLIQNLTCQWWPGWLHGANVPWKVSIEVNFLQDNGILSEPIKVCSRYLVLFLIFVALLLDSGAGQKLINLAISIAGRLTAGPAKVAVIGSALLGMVEGAATANVAAVGSFTIPMMKNQGFTARMAGAIEAVTSSGAQLVPPIMGASAFVMAGFLGVPYFRVCLAAIIPAIIYYVCEFFVVHFYGKRNGLGGLPKHQIPPLKKSMKEAWSVIIPFAVLIYFVARGYALSACATNAIIATLICNMIDPSTRWTPTKLLKALETGAKQSIIVVVACAAAGIIIGTFFVSGLGDTMSRQIFLGSHGIMIIALVICAIVSLILGMAMPTVAVYVTLLLVAIPALIKMGVPVFAAHFFCFYFGLLSAITPPVALAAYVAAGISGDNPIRTAITASYIAIPLYLVAFFLPYNQVMLWIGTPAAIAITLVLGIIASIVIAASIGGYFLVKTRPWENAMLMVGGLALIAPFTISKVGGLVLLALVVFSQKKIPLVKTM